MNQLSPSRPMPHTVRRFDVIMRLQISECSFQISDNCRLSKVHISDDCRLTSEVGNLKSRRSGNLQSTIPRQSEICNLKSTISPSKTLPARGASRPDGSTPGTQRLARAHAPPSTRG